MAVEEVIDAVIDVIQKNIIAQANVTSDVTSGDTIINVDNAFQMANGQEIVIMDYGYSNPSSNHYDVMEYATIKEVNNTTTITLTNPIEGNWLLSDQSFIQKTIGHSPLHYENVLYGDREVIPQQDMAITIEPSSLSNEWIYIQGGLSEEYRLRIMIYGKSIETNEGRRIIDRYSDAVYQLLNDRIHLDVNSHNTPLMEDVPYSSTTFKIQDTPENREYFISSVELEHQRSYFLQDNQGISNVFEILSVTPIVGNLLSILADRPIEGNYLRSEFGVAFRTATYIYDSRVDGITYGQVSKGSAVLRASELNWFGKRLNHHPFPQQSHSVNNFVKI